MESVNYRNSISKNEVSIYGKNNKVERFGDIHENRKTVDKLKVVRSVVVEKLASNQSGVSDKSNFFFQTFHQKHDSSITEESEILTVDGYHKHLNLRLTNMKRLQDRYKDELRGKTHIIKKVPFMDSTPDVLLQKQIQFRYWKVYLEEIGKQITYNNLHITELELKLALIRVFQRNIKIPQELIPTSNNYCPKKYLNNWKRIGEELENIVQDCIYGIPKRKPKLKNKIIFNPMVNLSIERREEIVNTYMAINRKDRALKKLKNNLTQV